MAGFRSILHLDMDAFFAAVEQRDRPELRGKPLLIGHDGPRGVVSTASYEARPFGCHSAQPMSVAKRLCPQAIVVPVRGSHYGEVSRQMFRILDEFSPLVEPLSVDEAFLDLTGSERALGPAEDVARRLRERIAADLRLTASVGVAPNKFLAKLASDLCKPDGMMVIRAEDVDRVLPPLPVTRLWGIGKVTAAKLEPLGIRTIADIRARPMEWLEQHLGSEAQRYYELARGIDERPVISDRDARSISHEQTFEVDVADADAVRQVLLEQVEQVARRLRHHGLLAQGVTLKIRYGNFQTVTRSTKLPAATDVTQELWEAARALFDAWPFRPVRLIGMRADRLSEETEMPTLFPDPARQKQKQIDSVADHIASKFGKGAIRRGGGGM